MWAPNRRSLNSAHQRNLNLNLICLWRSKQNMPPLLRKGMKGKPTWPVITDFWWCLIRVRNQWLNSGIKFGGTQRLVIADISWLSTFGWCNNAECCMCRTYSRRLKWRVSTKHLSFKVIVLKSRSCIKLACSDVPFHCPEVEPGYDAASALGTLRASSNSPLKEVGRSLIVMRQQMEAKTPIW